VAKEEQIEEYRFDKRTPEEQREIARQGGIASGKARREKATMKATLEKLLDEKYKNGKTYRELATLGLLKGAIKGNANNYRTILETLGELGQQTDTQQINNNITNIAKLINNPVDNRNEDNIDEVQDE
jgi:hypothetical protein